MQTTSVFLTTVSTALVTCGSAKSALIGQAWRSLLLPTMFSRIKHVTTVYKIVEVLHISIDLFLQFHWLLIYFQCNLLIIHFNKWNIYKKIDGRFTSLLSNTVQFVSVGFKKSEIQLYWNILSVIQLSPPSKKTFR